MIPVINMYRVVSHLFSMPVGAVSIMHFLQPSLMTSKSIIFLLFNIMLFNEGRVNEIAPNEEMLFAKAEHVSDLIYCDAVTTI